MRWIMKDHSHILTWLTICEILIDVEVRILIIREVKVEVCLTIHILSSRHPT